MVRAKVSTLPCRFRMVGAVQTRMCPIVPVPAKSVKPGKGPKAHIRIICAASGICQAVPVAILIPEIGLPGTEADALYIIDFPSLPPKSWQAVCEEPVLAGAKPARFPKVTAPDWANLEPKHQYCLEIPHATSQRIISSALGEGPANRPGVINIACGAWPAGSPVGRGTWPRSGAPRPVLWP
jgi:hypothetical protein